MIRFQNIYPKDIIAVVVLILGFILLFKGFDGWVQGVMALIIGYYFSKRVYEENHTPDQK